jgi:hypothetical protein
MARHVTAELDDRRATATTVLAGAGRPAALGARRIAEEEESGDARSMIFFCEGAGDNESESHCSPRLCLL